MALTLEQIAKRVHSIGSSDAAAIVGLNPWRSSMDVWLEKLGRVAPFQGNRATDAGDRLEEAVITYGVEQTKVVDVERGVELTHPERDYMTATLDARACVAQPFERIIIEGKTAGIFSPLSWDAWGEPGSDQIPDHYQVQVQHQLAVAGPEYRRAILSALLPPRGFVLFQIERDDQAIAALIEAEERFWLEHVVKQVEPDSRPSLEVAKKMKRVPKKQVGVPLHLVDRWRNAAVAKKAAVELEEKCKVDVIMALGDAEAGIFSGGMVTYFEQTKKESVQKESTFRVLRFKADKESKS